MNDPFFLLDVDEDADDESVRKAYLKQVRLFSPERHPERFQEIRTAYETIANHKDRLAFRLFHTTKPEPLPIITSILRKNQKKTPPNGTEVISLLSDSIKDFRFALDIPMPTRPQDNSEMTQPPAPSENL